MLNNYIVKSSVVFIIFNRPETTRKVFEVIRKVKPSKLFIIADGPRKNKTGEDLICNQTREIVEHIDWDCEVLRNYSNTNLGCKERISSGLKWLFEKVDEAIILEDDCLPDISFFRYCDELLEQYRNNENVMMISGNKVLYDYKVENQSYYFSRFAHIWGWATWKRTLQKYDVNLSDWQKIKPTNFLDKISFSSRSKIYWETRFEDVFNGLIDTWDYQLQYAITKNDGLAIIPAKNLVINLGFNDVNATHTKGLKMRYSKMKLETIDFPLIHPPQIEANLIADELESKIYHKLGIGKSIKRFLKKLKIIKA